MKNYVNELERCVEKYGSDKILSEYTPLYEPIFRPIRNNDLTILEIGIGTLLPEIQSTFIGNTSLYPQYTPGGSLRAWKEYFSCAKIYGIDVGEDCKIAEDRIETFIVDSTNDFQVNKTIKNLTFDIIIDDGLHTAQGQLATMKNFFYRVNEGGYYIIEDLGGGGDGLNFVVDHSVEFRNYADVHEWYFRGNMVVIRKNYSGKGQIHDFIEFFNESYKTTYIKRDEELQMEKISVEHPSVENLTVVTGLWNIAREGRDFSHYIEHFKRFLDIPVKLFIYLPKDLEYIVWENPMRTKQNTHVRSFELSDIKSNFYATFWDKTQEIRTSSEWMNKTGEHGWLKHSPQAVNEWYNPIVQSKMFMLHDAKVMDVFNTEYFIWLDAGITNTVYEKFFTENNCLEKIIPYLSSFLFLSYPYEASNEIHGFDFASMNNIAKTSVKYVCRGGLFGGHKDCITQANATYYTLLDSTLKRNLMGTEESIFSIMAHLEPHVYRRYALDGNGLIVKFVQALLENTVELEPIPNNRKFLPPVNLDVSNVKTSLYMLTFNFPEQVEYTIQTYLKHPEWLESTRKILIDNSNKQEAIAGNKMLCEKYGFEHIITNENLGINRGRFLAAKHFDESDSDYYIFLEDDMGLHPAGNGFCRNGLRTYVPNLFMKIHKIMKKEKFDFLKLSFTEVYMDNYMQVSWYNVPQVVRDEIWPEYNQLPISGLDTNCPRTEFKRIDIYEDLLYISGEVYYANWPMIMGKEGNRKVFLETTWEHPYEQTWMSHIFQETRKGNIHPGILLASPICHNRIAYYKPEERREN